MSSPRILLIDIETFPNVGYTWGKYEQTVISFVREWELASFAWKELERGKVQVLARPDFPRCRDDSALVKAVREVVDRADILVGHNIDRFDSPMLKKKFVLAGQLPPYYQTIDTRKMARTQIRFNSNKLNDLAETLGLGKKIETGGFELWTQCMDGNRRAWATMRRYNARDVELLEHVYLKLRAWAKVHPNFALYSGPADRPECPVCESTHVQRRGYIVHQYTRRAKFQCVKPKCGKWFSIALSKLPQRDR